MNPEPFENWFKSFHQFMNETPVKGFLNTIDDFFKQPMFPKPTFPVSVRDLDDKYSVTAELPGVRKEQIGINILGDNLSITVNKQDVTIHEDSKRNVFQQKESLSQIRRTVTFPQPIEERKVKASYHDGLLEIIIPKVKGTSIDITQNKSR